jgi:hypothetical protein
VSDPANAGTQPPFNALAQELIRDRDQAEMFRWMSEHPLVIVDVSIVDGVDGLYKYRANGWLDMSNQSHLISRWCASYQAAIRAAMEHV